VKIPGRVRPIKAGSKREVKRIRKRCKNEELGIISQKRLQTARSFCQKAQKII